MPSLSSLRAFEAAARYASFRLAAEELNVTHSAISHQVKVLEEYLSVPLFSRGGRTVTLTEEGAVLFLILREAFDQIVTGTDLLRRRKEEGNLTIQVYVTLAVKWLLPRLQGFSEAHPEVKIALSTSYKDWDFSPRDADAAILQIAHKHSKCDYLWLGNVHLFPVCAPSLLKKGPELKSPEDLRQHRILNVYPAKHDWRDWLSTAGVSDLNLYEGGSRFDSYLLSLEEAIAGVGISLANMAYVRDDLKKGRLIMPFDIQVESRAPWYFVCPKERRNEPRIVKFRNWLLTIVESASDRSGFT